MTVRLRILDYLRSCLADDPPSLRLVFWDGDCFEFVSNPSVTITLRSPRLLKLLLAGNFVRLGDAYVAGDLTVDGPVEDIVQIGIALAERIGKSSVLDSLRRFSSFIPARPSRRKTAADISHHYDISNDFYRLWLDDYMNYSCAYFHTGSED